MIALLDWVRSVPPLTMGQLVVFALPFMLAQSLALLLLFKIETAWRRALPAERQNGGPDG